MKVVISSMGEKLESKTSDVFGRCPYFIIAEIKDGKIEKTESVKNESMDQTTGAGVSAAQLVVEKGANAAITENVGPRAKDVLKQFNVKIYSGEGIVENVLQKFIDGKLEKIN
ncbi:dinitrogenase iron-molybdenum cofactor biosynthesis protein [bacterium]|nr:MAG: dinitrogenase iron-molybdenum cofactor biosynthesis protein [bacterium]